MTKHAWTPNDITRLLELNEKGLTGAQIATELGVSRNSVIGKLHYLKARLQSPSALAIQKGQNRHGHKHTKRRIAYNDNALAQRIANPYKVTQGDVMQSKSKPVTIFEATSKPLTIFELKNSSCRWPLWNTHGLPLKEKLFCGADTELKGPYCVVHSVINSSTPYPRRFAPRPFRRQS